MIVSETWSRGRGRRRSIACRGRDREQGPRRQEEDGGADQALPGRPPAVSLLTKITSHILQLSKSWRAARRLGQGLVGAAVFLLPPRSLLAVSPATSYGTPSPPTPRFAYDHIASNGVYPELCVIRCHVAHVPKCTRLPLRFSLSGQRSYAYVMRAEEGEPGNEAKSSKDSSVSSNYRPVALCSTLSKFLEHLILESYGDHLQSSHLQFGFKPGCSTTHCTGLVKSVVSQYLNRGSQVFGCFLDASKAFDLVDHQILFQKLLIVVFLFLFFGF